MILFSGQFFLSSLGREAKKGLAGATPMTELVPMKRGVAAVAAALLLPCC